MNCIIPGVNLKVVARALQALAKMGDELYIEAKKDTLSLITLNTAKTVCARFNFCESFFSCYNVNEKELNAENKETLTCKVHMKVLLPLFKGNLEKKLDFLKIDYDTDSDHMMFKMKYKCDDITMVHKLRLMDSETLSIGVNPTAGSNHMTATSSFYNNLLSVFNTSDDEITLEISKAKVIARNYCVGAPCRPKMMRSQINLHSSEFYSYRISQETTINFSLKPFRTAIHFAENFSLNIEFNFETGGKFALKSINTATYTAFTVSDGLFWFSPMPFGLRNAPATWQRITDAVFGTKLEPYVFVYEERFALKSINMATYTAFTVSDGLFWFSPMPFGLKNAPATWQRITDAVFGTKLEPYVFVYEERPLSMIMHNTTFEVNFIVATLNPAANDGNTSVTTSAVIARKIQARTRTNENNNVTGAKGTTSLNDVTCDDLEAMEMENWDSDLANVDFGGGRGGGAESNKSVNSSFSRLLNRAQNIGNEVLDDEDQEIRENERLRIEGEILRNRERISRHKGEISRKQVRNEEMARLKEEIHRKKMKNGADGNHKKTKEDVVDNEVNRRKSTVHQHDGSTDNAQKNDIIPNDDEDIVPASPESPRTKKAKLVFGRCYDPTFNGTLMGEVLAQNSDSE